MKAISSESGDPFLYAVIGSVQNLGGSMEAAFSRRVALSALAWGSLAANGTAAEAQPVQRPGRFRYCLNTSTIRGQKVGIVKEIEIAATAGYDAVEPWLGDLHAYVEGGHSLSDLAKRIGDAGLRVPSAIGFAPWIVDDPQARKEGLEQARRDMDLLAKIGGTRIAAPPVGAHTVAGPALPVIAERYRALLELGVRQGVIPQVEVWGFSKTLSRLAETVFVAVECGHPQACILPDIYHLYKGASHWESLSLLSASAVQVFHLNDYPAQPPRGEITDAHRVYPGDGVAPLAAVLKTLAATGNFCTLSLELFNRDYWQQDPLTVARTGLAKMRAVVANALPPQ